MADSRTLHPSSLPGTAGAMMRAGWLSIVLALALLGGCSTSPNGRMQVTAPAPVSNVYSEVDMRLNLASAGSPSNRCEPDGCSMDQQEIQQFDQRVQQTGSRLAEAAYSVFPDLGERVKRFEFAVAEKDKPGTTSNARGKIIVFRGVQKLQPDDTALAFLMAREMGGVIGQHHAENSATRILISVLAGVLFPASNLLNTTAATQTAFSSAMATTALSTATSYVGSRLALANIKPEQLNEADFIAMALLDHLGWETGEITASLAALPPIEHKNSWTEDFSTSVARLEALDKKLPADTIEIAEDNPLPVQQQDEGLAQITPAMDPGQVALGADIEPSILAEVAPSGETGVTAPSMEQAALAEPDSIDQPVAASTVAPMAIAAAAVPATVSHATTRVKPALKTASLKQQKQKAGKSASSKTSRLAARNSSRVAAKNTKTARIAAKAQAKPSAKRSTSLALASFKTDQGKNPKGGIHLPVLAVKDKPKKAAATAPALRRPTL
jgi:hypothetical protein